MTEQAKELTVIDLSDRYNHCFSADLYDVKLGGGRLFKRANVNLAGIPFSIPTGELNCIAPPPPPAENEDIIDNFGARAKRRFCRPISRDGETRIEIGGKRISEIFFLMAIE